MTPNINWDIIAPIMSMVSATHHVALERIIRAMDTTTLAAVLAGHVTLKSLAYAEAQRRGVHPQVLVCEQFDVVAYAA